MKSILFLFLFISLGSWSQESTDPITIGETVTFRSKTLNESRSINVYLPQSYHPDSLQSYPVIYLLDGSLDEDFHHIAGLVQFASFPWIELLPETIVIGISNVDRKRDYTFPTTIEQDKIDFPTTGGSEKFIDYLESELRPFVDSAYSTNGTNTLIGQSLGGLLATEILFKHTALFDTYCIVSPSLWWNNQSLLELPIEDNFNAPRVYIAVGKEGKIMQRDAKNLYKKLKPALPDDQVFFEYFKEQDHGDVLHLAIYKAFECLKTIE